MEYVLIRHKITELINPLKYEIPMKLNLNN